MKSKVNILSLAAAVLLCGVQPSQAEVRLPGLISNDMVLQRNADIRLWGWADPGERVTVRIDNQEKSVTAGSDRRWKLELEPMSAGGPYQMTVSGKNTIVLENILIGEVWVCSGQSNMEWHVKYSADAEREIADGNHPLIRLFMVKKGGAGEPRDDCGGIWTRCTPQTVGEFSGVGYYFGRELMRELDVPVGLIQSAWGGTAAVPWTSFGALRNNPVLRPITEKWTDLSAEKKAEIEDHHDLMAHWFVYCFACMARNVSYGPIPKGDFGAPSWLYNAMIAPLTNATIQGTIWYQGESDSGLAYRYRTLFPTLIQDWRTQWGLGDFPFLFVQLSNFNEPNPEPTESEWSELREAQLMTLELPNTGMAVTIDLGETDDVHFRNKQDVGRRLALSALRVAYGRDIVHSGPLYDSVSFKSSRAHITFTSTGSGLATKDNEPLKGFAIAGPDSQFVWAEARLDGKNVIVWNNSIPDPVAVRYGWGDNPGCNLYNREELPASPFRTDDWPGKTAGR